MSQVSDDCEREFESLLHRPVWIHRLVDTKAARSTVGAQPADYLIGQSGHLHLAEVKLCHEAVSFPLGNLRLSQKTAIGMAVRLNFPYRVYVKNGLTGQWYIVPAEQILNTLTNGKKSIKWLDLEPSKWKMTTPT